MIIFGNNSASAVNSSTESNLLNLKGKLSSSNDSQFKNVFDSAITANRRNAQKLTAIDNKEPKNYSDNSGYKSFKEVQYKKDINSGSNKVAKGKETPLKDINEVDETLGKSAGKSSEEGNPIIDVLAQMLGLSPNELSKLANDLGFSAEDLCDSNNLTKFVGKLSDVLGLNEDQNALINQLAGQIANELNLSRNGQSTEIVNNIEESNKNDDPKSISIAVDTKSNPDANLAKMIEQVKARLNDLATKVNVESISIQTEVKQTIESLRAKANISIAVNDGSEESSQSSVPVTETIAINPVEEKLVETKLSDKSKEDKYENKSDNKSDNKSESTEENADLSTQSVSSLVQAGKVVNEVNRQLNEQNINVIGGSATNTIKDSSVITKTHFTMPQHIVNNAEIVNQVIEQAKVVIGQDKTEMVINLKPDHLGKLALKVVTEQGIVAAKFIAESQQVKEIIETNMQQLKENLEKQGIMVDSVSVQVGNDRQQEYQSSAYSNPKGTGNKRNSLDSEIGTVAVGIGSMETLPDRLAKYSSETSTISIKA